MGPQLSSIGLLFVIAILDPIWAENGDCEGRKNAPGRNLIHKGALEVNPCSSTPAQVFVNCKVDDKEKCTTQVQNGEDTDYDILIGDYDPDIGGVEFALLIPMTAEFYIHAHESDENATIADEAYGTKIGYFEDKLFDAEGKSCNSYACCDPDAPSRTNVARRCPTMGSNPKTKVKGKDEYSISYIWHPPKDFKGHMTLSAEISPSPTQNYEKVNSKAIFVDTIAQPPKVSKEAVKKPAKEGKPTKEEDGKPAKEEEDTPAMEPGSTKVTYKKTTTGQKKKALVNGLVGGLLGTLI